MADDQGFSAYLVTDIAQYGWWSFAGGGRGQLNCLWFPVDGEDEAALLGSVTSAWSDQRWLGMGTAYAPQGKPSPERFSARFPGLVEEVFASSESADARGFSSASEWGVIDPLSAQFESFFRRLRQSRGKGWCLALSSRDVSLRTWYALSAGFWWRAALAINSEASTLEEIDRSIIGEYLACAVEQGYLPLFPLDNHPYGGIVLFGKSADLVGLAEKVPQIPTVESAEFVESIWRNGGGPAC
ncbi:hypothetical protein [Saccharopolyspora shandongensis]|uniref:hypothetical protein n=1 Tax=Saccharopolyspora shandongensis TaxID=418495 RepID=UPI0033E4B3C4